MLVQLTERGRREDRHIARQRVGHDHVLVGYGRLLHGPVRQRVAQDRITVGVFHDARRATVSQDRWRQTLAP